MKFLLSLFFASNVFYSGKVEYRSGFGPTQAVQDNTPGWVKLNVKPKYVKRTDSTVTVRYPGTTVVYLLNKQAPEARPAVEATASLH